MPEPEYNTYHRLINSNNPVKKKTIEHTNGRKVTLVPNMLYNGLQHTNGRKVTLVPNMLYNDPYTIVTGKRKSKKRHKTKTKQKKHKKHKTLNAEVQHAEVHHAEVQHKEEVFREIRDNMVVVGGGRAPVPRHQHHRALRQARGGHPPLSPSPSLRRRTI